MNKFKMPNLTGLRICATAVPVTSTMSSTAWAQQQGGPSWGPHMWNGGPWMFFGPMMMLIVIAVIVVMVVLLVRWLGGSGLGHGHGLRHDHSHGHDPVHHHRAAQAPLDILKERFARGEIDTEEYQERRRVLDERADPRDVS